jgi:hypothetical protein
MESQRSGYTNPSIILRVARQNAYGIAGLQKRYVEDKKERTVACVLTGSQRSFSSPSSSYQSPLSLPISTCSQSFLVYACSRPLPIITIPAGSAVSLKKLFQKRSSVKIKNNSRQYGRGLFNSEIL